MRKGGTADINLGLTHKRNDHSDIADGNFCHRHLFDVDEPGIKIPRARKQNLLLQTPSPATCDKSLPILEVIVVWNYRPCNLTRLNRSPIQRCDNAHLVRLHRINLQLLRTHAVLSRISRSNYLKQCGINSIGTSGQKAKLTAFFAALGEEFARILKVIARYDLTQNAL